jgi:signal transduction histidine kinase
VRRLRERFAGRGPRVRDVALIVFSLSVGLGQTAAVAKGGGPFGVAWSLCTVVASTTTLWWRRRWPVGVSVVGIVAALAGQPAVLLIGLLTTAVRRRDRVLRLMSALGYVALVVQGVLNGQDWVGSAVSAVFVLGAFVGWGAYVGARRDLLGTLRERAERAEGERELRAEQARQGERTRIAREMHDVLAHKMSLVALHAGGLEVNPDAGPAQVERTAALIRTTSREALEDLRSVLGVLRDDADPGADLRPQPGLDGLGALVESSRSAGVVVRLDVDLTAEPPEVVGRTAYRVAQEALTNVHKHARGAATRIAVRGAPGSDLEVEVVNVVPVAAGSLLPGSGLGLVGLAERVGLLGGSLACGPLPDGGWRVHARMPWGATGPAPISAARR